MQKSKITPKKLKRLKDLRDTVLLTCNPPDDCDDPVVLKTYMKACFDKATDQGEAMSEKVIKPKIVALIKKYIGSSLQILKALEEKP